MRNQKEATTTTEGYTGDTYCLGCGEKIASGTVIPKKTSGGSGGTSSGGSSSNDGEDSTIIDRPDKDDPSCPTTGQTAPVKPGTNGNANIDGNAVQDAINKAAADAEKNGNTANGIAVVVPVNVGDTRKDVQIILKADTLLIPDTGFQRKEPFFLFSNHLLFVEKLNEYHFGHIYFPEA